LEVEADVEMRRMWNCRGCLHRLIASSTLPQGRIGHSFPR
jgi:hypothetical protein